MYHQNTLKILSHQYVGMFAVYEKGIKKIWSPSPIPWIPSLKKYGVHPHSMESIPHPMESILKKYEVHPPFHGKSMESIPHSMDSIWINLGRVKYWSLVIFSNDQALLLVSTLRLHVSLPRGRLVTLIKSFTWVS